MRQFFLTLIKKRATFPLNLSSQNICFKKLKIVISLIGKVKINRLKKKEKAFHFYTKSVF